MYELNVVKTIKSKLNEIDVGVEEGKQNSEEMLFALNQITGQRSATVVGERGEEPHR